MRNGEQTIKFARHSLILGALIISFSGLIIRNIESADSWTIIFYRAMAFTFAVLCYVLFKHRSKVFQQFSHAGRQGVAGGIILGLTNITYIVAITNTTVANTLFTVSLIPFITALLAFLSIKERIPMTTVLAMFVALLGIIVMFRGSIVQGQLFGNLMALITAFLFSIFAVLIRINKKIDMLISLAIGGVVSLLVALVVTQIKLEASLHDILLCFVLGGVLSGFANIVFTLATRYVAAGEATFYMFIEFALGPFWVWLFIYEKPSNTTLYGGLIIFTALLTKAIADSRKVV